MSNTIADIAISVVEYPLVKPYVLSFATLHHVTSVQVTITANDGQARMAEVVPLPGYNDETVASVSSWLHEQAPTLVGLTLENAREKTMQHQHRIPFTVSPILTAIDLFDTEWPAPKGDVHYVLPTATADPEKLIATAAKAISNNQELKVKLSGNPAVDKDGLTALFTAYEHLPWKVRLDANQGFSHPDAGNFYGWLRDTGYVNRIAYVEQPLHAFDWEGAKMLKLYFPEVPTMLDETVVTAADVARAIDLGIPFVKLKLFKQGGMRELEAQSRQLFEAGVKVVLGNGVATKISNHLENSLYDKHRGWFYGHSEGNGFLKVKPT